MFYYCPLESYKERYTMQWSAPITGWLERNWIEAGIPYVRIDSPDIPHLEDIQTGIVLDASRRTKHCFSQIEQIVKLAVEGKIGNGDIIYFDDFWHLGIEALPYTFHQLGIKPKMFAFCHAQSVDEFDFTYPMRYWMRHFEKGIAKVLTGIFVNSTVLKELLYFGGVCRETKVHVIGHIFSPEEVMERMPRLTPPREDNVIFSSRWDREKNPKFFLKVAKAVIQMRPKARFIVCTSQKELKSNDPSNLKALAEYKFKYPSNVFLKENLTKEEYYRELCKAKIQMNTANQDFVSICLLEASVAGCWPLYPYFRSFPEALENDMKYMYSSIDEAVEKTIMILDQDDLWSSKERLSRAWIHRKHSLSWARMINIMMDKKAYGIDMPAYE